MDGQTDRPTNQLSGRHTLLLRCKDASKNQYLNGLSGSSRHHRDLKFSTFTENQVAI